MIEPAKPENENARVASLVACNVLDTPAENRFDRLTHMGALAFGVPICLISLVDRDRQWFKSKVGVDATETPRNISFCGHAILAPKPLIVPDALLDPRFHDNPLVVGAPHVRFYAGYPLDDGAGRRLGTFCIIDSEPREMTDGDRELLDEFGSLVEVELTSMGLEAAVELAQAEADWLELITESVVDGLVTINNDGRIVGFNAAAESMFDYPRQEITGRYVTDLMPEHYRADYLGHVSQAGDAGNLKLWRDVEGRRRDGSVFPIDLCVTQAQFGGEVFYIGRVSDMSDRRAAEKALKASDDLHRSVISALEEGVLVVRGDGYIEEVNGSAASVLGIDPGNIAGRNLADLSTIPEFQWLGEDGNPLTPERRPVLRTLGSGEPVSGEIVGLRRATGEMLWLSVNSRAIGDLVDGRAERAVLSFVDVTHRREVDRMKSEFVAVVSHELRTPLTSIRGALGLLYAGKMGQIDDAAQRMLGIAVSNTDRLIRLINDILDIERMEAGRLTMDLGVVELSALIEQAAAVMRPMALEVDVDLAVWSEPVQIWADGDRLLQMLTNLLSNAIKFSPPGGVVDVSVEQTSSGVSVHVRDQGRGIPPDKVEHIFGRFQQVDATDSREKGGTGLGLAICREIAERHDGRIWVVSRLGEGSTFSFTIPVDPSKIGAPERDQALERI